MLLSKMIRASSVDDILTLDNWFPTIDESKVQEQISRFCLQFITYQPQQEVATGDIVTADLVSDTAKFNRNLKINVGKGFFDKELEAKLCGVRLHEPTSIQHSTAGVITVTVTDIQRLQVPPLTDEIVARGNLEGIHTAEEYRQSIRREIAKEDILQKAYEYLDTLSAQSDFDIDQGEIEALVEKEMDRCRDIARSQGTVFDEMSKEQLLGAVGQPDIPSFKNMIRGMAAGWLKTALLALHWQGRSADRENADLMSVNDLTEQAVLYLYERMMKSYAL